MVKDPQLKGEHFHGNNPDMKLDFTKPTKAEIDEMNYKKPISKKTAVKQIRDVTEVELKERSRHHKNIGKKQHTKNKYKSK